MTSRPRSTVISSRSRSRPGARACTSMAAGVLPTLSTGKPVPAAERMLEVALGRAWSSRDCMRLSSAKRSAEDRNMGIMCFLLCGLIGDPELGAAAAAFKRGGRVKKVGRLKKAKPSVPRDQRRNRGDQQGDAARRQQAEHHLA